MTQTLWFTYPMATADTSTRSDEIAAIVREEHDRMYAEIDAHHHTRFRAPYYSYRHCECGWTAPSSSKNASVSVGVHVKAAQRKAEKAARARIDDRIAATRRPIN